MWMNFLHWSDILKILIQIIEVKWVIWSYEMVFLWGEVHFLSSLELISKERVICWLTGFQNAIAHNWIFCVLHTMMLSTCYLSFMGSFYLISQNNFLLPYPPHNDSLSLIPSLLMFAAQNLTSNYISQCVIPIFVISVSPDKPCSNGSDKQHMLI